MTKHWDTVWFLICKFYFLQSFFPHASQWQDIAHCSVCGRGCICITVRQYRSVLETAKLDNDKAPTMRKRPLGKWLQRTHTSTHILTSQCPYLTVCEWVNACECGSVCLCGCVCGLYPPSLQFASFIAIMGANGFYSDQRWDLLFFFLIPGKGDRETVHTQQKAPNGFVHHQRAYFLWEIDYSNNNVAFWKFDNIVRISLKSQLVKRQHFFFVVSWKRTNSSWD